MPTYQYACTECGHRLEAVQTFSDDPLTECPRCHGRLRKVFSAVGIVFKGSGFYRTDSRAAAKAASGAKADSGSDKPAAADSAATTAGKESSRESGKESGKESAKKPVKESRAPRSPAAAKTA